MSADVAGATLMAAASSSPELFISCVGTFVTEGDLGVGAVVGSAVFNVLAVPACCALLASRVTTLLCPPKANVPKLPLLIPQGRVFADGRAGPVGGVARLPGVCACCGGPCAGAGRQRGALARSPRTCPHVRALHTR